MARWSEQEWLPEAAVEPAPGAVPREGVEQVEVVAQEGEVEPPSGVAR